MKNGDRETQLLAIGMLAIHGDNKGAALESNLLCPFARLDRAGPRLESGHRLLRVRRNVVN
jgi:hypothetical protein